MAQKNSLLPDYTTPAELAEHLGCNERALRKKAREIGACSVIGNKMVHTADHVKQLMEATKPCPSNSTDAGTSGTTEARLTAGGYEELRAQRTASERKESRRNAKRKSGKVISMDQGRR